MKTTRKDFYMEIRKSPGRFLSILFIVALGVAFFSGIRASEPDMRLSGDSYFDDSELMDIKVMSSYGITKDDIEALEQTEGVAGVEGAYSADLLYNSEEEQQVLHVMSMQKQMNQAALSEGRFPQKAGECMADDASGYKIGDKITLESGTEEPLSDLLATDTLEVTGLGSSPCYISYGRGSAAVGNGNISAFLIVPEETFKRDVYTEAYIQAAGARKLTAFTEAYTECVDEVRKNIENITKERALVRQKELAQTFQTGIENIELPKWYIYDRDTLSEYSSFGENAERLGAIGRVFPVLFFLVAALISLTSMTRMVEEQRTAIGTMKALGYGRMVIAGKYMGYAFLAAAGGSLIGVLAGEKILPYIIVYAYGILYQNLPQILVPYQWEYAILASAVAVFCTLSATFMACYKELRAQPAVLMRPPAPKNGSRVFLERIGILWRHLNFTRKSTVRNLMRYKKRFFMTIFGIGGCMALMLVGFGLKDSCYEIAELQYSDIQFYDGSIYLEEEATGEERKELEELLDRQKEIRQYMEASMQKVTLKNGEEEHVSYECVFSSADEIPQFVDFHDRRTREPFKLSDDGVIISEKTAKLLKAKAGDTIQIKDDEAGDKKIKISHICENYLGHYIYFTPAYYEEVYGNKPEYNSLFFVADDDASSAQIEKAGQEILKQKAALSVSYMHDIEKQLDDMLRSLNLVIVVLIISAGMLAFVVLYNLNTVNIAERKRELATLKVLGFYDGEVAGYVYRENILLTFIGAAVGVILGKFLHMYIIQTVEVDSAMFGRNINLPSFVYSLLLTILFSMLINGIMYFKLKQINMVESLKSIE